MNRAIKLALWLLVTSFFVALGFSVYTWLTSQRAVTWVESPWFAFFLGILSCISGFVALAWYVNRPSSNGNSAKKNSDESIGEGTDESSHKAPEEQISDFIQAVVDERFAKLRQELDKHQEEHAKAVQDQHESLYTFSRSEALVVNPDDIQVSLDDVGGLAQAKAELTQIIRFLKNPDPFRRLGARLPRGVLLEGPSGTGKTMLARALAKEAAASFIETTASSYIQIFGGTGAARIRDLFKMARDNEPCIVFIDELDSIGQRRSGITTGEERIQTLNQLLTEIDGFSNDNAVVVLAATNRADVLDDALVRPGRFDKKVRTTLPDSSARSQIIRLQSHAIGRPVAPGVDLGAITDRTAGLTGAEIEGLFNEAALSAGDDNRSRIEQEDIERGFENTTFRRPVKTLPRDIETSVSQHVSGQTDAIQIASVALGAWISQFESYLDDTSRRGSTHLLVRGPRGVGKSLLVQSLLDNVQLPFARLHVSGLESPYILEDAMHDLEFEAKGDWRLAENGIIWFYGDHQGTGKQHPSTEPALIRLFDRLQIGAPILDARRTARPRALGVGNVHVIYEVRDETRDTSAVGSPCWQEGYTLFDYVSSLSPLSGDALASIALGGTLVAKKRFIALAESRALDVSITEEGYTEILACAADDGRGTLSLDSCFSKLAQRLRSVERNGDAVTFDQDLVRKCLRGDTAHAIGGLSQFAKRMKSVSSSTAKD